MSVATIAAATKTARTLVQLDIGQQACAAPDYFANDGATFLICTNGSGQTNTLTLVYTATPDGAALTNKTVAILAGKSAIIGPFPQALYNDATNNVEITYSSITTMTIGAFKLGT